MTITVAVVGVLVGLCAGMWMGVRWSSRHLHLLLARYDDRQLTELAAATRAARETPDRT